MTNTEPGRERIPDRYADRIPPPGQSGHAEQDNFGKVRGWRPSRSYKPCLRWVAGKRCAGGSCPGCGIGLSSLLDHPRLWLIGTGGRVLTAEPYDMGADWQQRDLAKLREFAQSLGLAVEEFPDLSVWYPPYTSLLLVRRAGVPVPLTAAP